MAGEILHHHHRQRLVIVRHPDGVLRAIFVVLDQGLRLQSRAVQRQRPGLADAAHVRQRLFYDHPTVALAVENFEDQVKVAIANLFRLDQRSGIVHAAKLPGILNGIRRGEGTVLRHCLSSYTKLKRNPARAA